jgi:hypothetical protein
MWSTEAHKKVRKDTLQQRSKKQRQESVHARTPGVARTAMRPVLNTPLAAWLAPRLASSLGDRLSLETSTSAPAVSGHASVSDAHCTYSHGSRRKTTSTSAISTS